MLARIEVLRGRLKLLLRNSEQSQTVSFRAPNPSIEGYIDSRRASRQLIEEAGGKLYGETLAAFDQETYAFLEFLGKE